MILNLAENVIPRVPSSSPLRLREPPLQHPYRGLNGGFFPPTVCPPHKLDPGSRPGPVPGTARDSRCQALVWSWQGGVWVFVYFISPTKASPTPITRRLKIFSADDSLLGEATWPGGGEERVCESGTGAGGGGGSEELFLRARAGWVSRSSKRSNERPGGAHGPRTSDGRGSVLLTLLSVYIHQTNGPTAGLVLGVNGVSARGWVQSRRAEGRCLAR